MEALLSKNGMEKLPIFCTQNAVKWHFIIHKNTECAYGHKNS